MLVVDSHVSPGGAWALREELKAITPKPIRWVVNSHYHFDHSHGNQIYGPEVEIIGHEFARQQILAGKSQDSPAREFYVGGIPATIKNLEGRLAAAKDDKEKATIQAQLDIQRTFLEGTNAVKPTPPTMTLTQTMTLHRGAREIRILFLGRGHTAGDVVVYLPKERIVATGDLLVEGTSYMGDAFFTDWIETIEALKKLDFDTVLPGHGAAFTDKAKLDHWQAYVRDFWAQAQKFHKAGTPWEEAAKQVDLRGNAANYPRDPHGRHHAQPRDAARLRDPRREGEVRHLPGDGYAPGGSDTCRGELTLAGESDTCRRDVPSDRRSVNARTIVPRAAQLDSARPPHARTSSDRGTSSRKQISSCVSSSACEPIAIDTWF